jgi:glutathione synthase/RimK-type ligase-like ATP-grasp enzyme
MPQRPKPRVLVITDKRDVHVPFVQVHIPESLLVIDPKAIVEGVELTYRLRKGKLVVIYNGKPLDSVVGVWYRRPQYPGLENLSVTEGYKGYAVSALAWHMDQLRTAFKNAVLVSDYYAMWRASNKSWQLDVAGDLGFHIPETVITSSAITAKRFIDTHDRVIVKSMSTELPVTGGVKKVFYTTVLDKSSLPDLNNLRLAPAIFQEALDTDYDLRVTVVGTKVFTAAVHNENLGKDPTLLDWRERTHKLHLEPFTLPDDLEKRCVELVGKLGLLWGAIDLVMDKKGKIWFLENNSNGQWAFVEQACGLPIGKAFADLLSGKR